MSKQAQEENQQLLAVLGQLVSMVFWGDHITRDEPRGPFTESADWIRAHLTFALTDQEIIIKTSDNEAEPRTLKKLLKGYLSCPLVSSLQTNTILLQGYLYSSTTTFLCRIPSLMTTERLLVLLIGSVSRSCYYGELVDSLDFLKGEIEMRSRKRKITLRTMAKKTLVGLTTRAIYWEHLLEHELTILRDVFLKEIKNIEPR
jgi:hypothetical protein